MSRTKPVTSNQLSATSSPGVYFFRGPKNKVLYIGKAANLKHRLSYYKKTVDPRIVKMLETAVDLDWQETGSEIEALILESQLIKKHRPLFNIMLRDDKQYFYVGITKETFPSVFLTHQPKLARAALANFVGPFTEGASLKSTLKILRRIFPYCTCKQKHHRYCLNYYLGNCLGFCCLKAQTFSSDREKSLVYKKNIKAIRDILNGGRISVFKNLKKEMRQSAKNHDFEKAIDLRKKLDQLQRVFENARVIKELASRSKVLEEIQKALGLSSLPQRIEGYDISNIQGQFATGAMVVFNNGYPDKNEYRKFKIRTVSPNEGGDVAMLKEILIRRFNHPEWPFPDLILIDGGKGQLNAAYGVISNFQFSISNQFSMTQFSKSKIPVIALTKDDRHHGHHIFLSTKKELVALQDLSLPVKNLILQIDSEAHRFAISYYRRLHRKTI